MLDRWLKLYSTLSYHRDLSMVRANQCVQQSSGAHHKLLVNGILLIMHIIQKLLIAGLLALTVYTFWPRDNDQIPAIEQWNLAVDSSGSTQFMGLVFGETSLAKAQLIFDGPGEAAVFLGKKGQRKKPPQLEVFFDDLPEGGRIILNLEAGELLEQIVKAKHQPNVLPNGTIKLSVPPQYAKEVRRLRIASATFLPPVRIDLKSLEMVHGPPDSSIATVDGNLHLLYPALGLDLIRGEEGMDILQMVPLSQFPELVAPLEKEQLRNETTKVQ